MDQEYNSPRLSNLNNFKSSHRSTESDERSQINEGNLDAQHKQEIENYEQTFSQMRNDLLHTKYLYSELQDTHEIQIEKLTKEIEFLK